MLEFEISDISEFRRAKMALLKGRPDNFLLNGAAVYGRINAVFKSEGSPRATWIVRLVP